MSDPNLTDRQQKWFASVRASLERDSGRTLAEWVEIARACPETSHRARLKWFKETHGLLQNRASQVLAEAFPSTMGWAEPNELIDTLWSDARSRTIFETVHAAATALGETRRTARKSYVAWSRRVQFAAARPLKDGRLMLGLAVTPDVSPRLDASRSESWSERLRSRIALSEPAAVDELIRSLLKLAWDGA